MKKIFMLSLAIVIFICNTAVLGAAGDWKTYTNKQFGYEIQFPANGKLAATGEEVRKNFYLDPLQPVTDLNHTPAFTNIRLYPHSLVKIAFPDKYLIMLVLDHIPPNIPPPDSQPVSIGQQLFYQKHSWDAGMCHNYDYYTYFLQHNSRYYVFIFLLTANCYSNQNAAEASYADTRDFESILSTFRWKSPAPAGV